MPELQFKIIIVPINRTDLEEQNRLLSQIKGAVEDCGVKVVSINYSQAKKTEEYPELEELSIEVHAISEKTYPGGIPSQYKEFCSRWKHLSQSVPCSYVVLYGNDCFTYPKYSHVSNDYSRLSFGILPHNGLYYEYASLSETGNLVHFYHDTRNVNIKYRKFELTFSYDNIRNIFVNINKPYEILFDLFNPPLIFREEEVKPRYGVPYKLRHRNLNLKDNMSDDFSLLLDGGYKTSSLLNKDVLGRANILSLHLYNSDIITQIVNGIHFHCSEKSIHYSRINSVSGKLSADPVLSHFHFGCAYLITAMLKRNFVLVVQASDIYGNLAKLDGLSKTNPDCLEKALIVVLSALDSGKILNFWHAIEDQYQYYLTNKDEINFKEYIVPSKCSMIRRIMLTPTRQLLWPPEIMYGNRVLRNFEAEYALRVSFRDDNMSRMSFNALFADKGVLDSCIKIPMTSGVRIGLRHYEFLAWSNSQIRDHGVWLYAKDSEGRSASHIREWMGDFSHIHNVPKYMARMGQCFSSTEDALSVPLDPEHVRTEMDIEGGFDSINRKPYCFSDGVGRISTQLSAKVHDALGHDKLCSAFQIRYGGCKGMLVTDPTLRDADIVFRKSMKKFESPKNTRLEIAKTSAPIPLQLNRPFITLLNDLGVRHRTFLRLQEEMLTNLTDMLFDESKASAFLKSKTPITSLNYEDLSRSGIFLTTEPFFKSLLLALHRHHIEHIKTRANIAIDPSKGRNMLGVVDETGILQYGEVFVQYTTDISYGETTKDTTILRGEVLVTKNPCLHPGDVRKFYAVDIPQLHHIVDCIVFPQKGHRPHSNEMAGSDMDGDEYSVLWFPDLIFHGANKSPANFPEIRSVDVPFISVAHMINFLQEYIKNDQVGVLANAHLAHADYRSIQDELCLSIAKKFSVAIDFAKNGKSESLSKEERPEMFPDFMEKFHREVYKSKKALGKMYRVCKDFESENQETSIAYQDIKVDPDLVYEGWESYKDDAVVARNRYNALFKSVLRNYGIQHEAEALSGAFTNLHCRFHERKDRNEIEKVIVGCVKQLHKSMLRDFLQDFTGAGEVAEVDDRMLKKASAWYIVTYSDPNAKFLSFPWTVSNYLVNMKLRKTLANPPCFSPAIMCLDKKILECESKNLLPHYIETGIWNDYDFQCDPLIVKHALRTLILWAQDEEIIEGPRQNNRRLLYVDTFIRLFLHVADMFGYMVRGNNYVAKGRVNFSSGEICLEFLKFCSSFRFYNKLEMDALLPFNVYKYSQLAKRSIVAYHRFALQGIFQSLYFDEKLEKELIRMKPLQIESKIFGIPPISQTTLSKAEETLSKYCKVVQLKLRELTQTKKVCVSARGSEQDIKELKRILNKKHVFLQKLFTSGIMPED